MAAEQVVQQLVDPPPMDAISELRYLLFLGAKSENFIPGIPCLKNLETFMSNEKFINRLSNNEKKDSLERAQRSLRCELFTDRSIVVDLVRDGRHQEVIDCLTEASERNTGCWQEIMTCLVTLVRGEHSNAEAKAASYKAMVSLVKDSSMLFFFLQSLKVASLAKKSGFGRGLKKGIRRWYVSLSPARLLLELWHTPHKHGWAHKDVMKLVHLKQDDFVQGSKVIVQWFFSDLHQTKVIFAAEREATQYIRWLDDIFNKDHEDDLPMKRIMAIIELSGQAYQVHRQQDPIFLWSEHFTALLPRLSGAGVAKLVQDNYFINKVAPQKRPVPIVITANVIEPPELRAPEPTELQRAVSSSMQDRLAEADVALDTPPTDALMAHNSFLRRTRNYINNMHGRNRWRGGVQDEVFHNVDPEVARSALPDHLQPLLSQLERLVLHSIKEHRVSESLPGLLLVLEPTYSPNKFINSSLGNVVHKQMRVGQAMLMASRLLCHRDGDDNGGFGSRVNRPYKPRMDTGSADVHPVDFHQTEVALKALYCLEGDLRSCCQDLAQQLTVTSKDHLVAGFPLLRSHCEAGGFKQLVYCSQILSADQIDGAYSYMALPPTATSLDRVVLVSCESTLLSPRTQFHPRVLVVNGFDQRTMSTISNFLLDKF